MTCGYCGGRNYEDENRCRRCGRKRGDALPSEVAVNRTDGALAAQPQPAAHLWSNAGATACAAPGPVGLERSGQAPRNARPVQGSLFWEKPAGKVIPFESFQTAPSSPPSRSRARTASGPKSSKASSRRSAYVHEGQGELDFLPPVPPKPRTLST